MPAEAPALLLIPSFARFPLFALFIVYDKTRHCLQSFDESVVSQFVLRCWVSNSRACIFCKCPRRFVLGFSFVFSLFIFCGSGRLASLSTPGWVGWMGLYTALLFFAVFLCDFYLDLCPSLVFSICAISMMYLLGCDGWEATVLCSPLPSLTY